MKTALTIAIPWMLMWSACASTGDANGSGTPAAAAALAPDASTFYVRPDGGSPSQRSGRVDAAYTEVLKSAPGIIPFARFRRTARRVSPGGTR